MGSGLWIQHGLPNLLTTIPIQTVESGGCITHKDASVGIGRRTPHFSEHVGTKLRLGQWNLVGLNPLPGVKLPLQTPCSSIHGVNVAVVSGEVEAVAHHNGSALTPPLEFFESPLHLQLTDVLGADGGLIGIGSGSPNVVSEHGPISRLGAGRNMGSLSKDRAFYRPQGGQPSSPGSQ